MPPTPAFATFASKKTPGKTLYILYMLSHFFLVLSIFCWSLCVCVWCGCLASGVLSHITSAWRQVPTCSEDPRVCRWPPLCLRKHPIYTLQRIDQYPLLLQHDPGIIPMMVSLVLLTTSFDGTVKDNIISAENVIAHKTKYHLCRSWCW